MATRADYDSAWKDALSAYFREFLQILRPKTYARIDWTHPPEFLDKELEAVTCSSAKGRLLVDKLVSVRLKEGKDVLLLIHVEIQTRCDAEFATRMLDYRLRLQTNHLGRRLLDVAVLAGRGRKGQRYGDLGHEWMSHEYIEEDCSLRYTFPAIHLEWWRPRIAELHEWAPSNPFAVVILAQLEATAKTDAEEKLVRKVELIRHFEQWGITRDNRRMLFRLIDAMMRLPESLDRKFSSAVMKIQKDHKMTYLTSVQRDQLRRAEEKGERRGEKRGQERGRLEGKSQGQVLGVANSLTSLIVTKFGTLPDWARARIEDADEATLNRWTLRILDARRIEDVFE